MLSCASMSKLAYPSAATIGAATNASTTSLAPSSGAPSETQSEISSVDSDWSDIRSIAIKLGVANPEDLHTERFKVDRQKLEQMIKAESPVDEMNGAEYFFETVMKSTGTYVSWPCRLKIGAKSKKDPHVRIVGKVEDVVRAKERILGSLDSRGTRVIMKMDVSYTDHSYIIGRGGNNIKRIMEETQTHIHFPDSNRTNSTEKSNQVSLCGSLEGVERARALVRLATPLLISFEPILAPGRQQPDHETAYVNMVETKYNVQVIFSTRPKLSSSLILVKGSEKDVNNVKEATQALINYSCESIASEILVSMQMELSPQHHEIVKGKNNSNLLNIMERTKTKIIFPDLSDMNVKQIKKSQVTITGTIDGVYKARQQLLGNLPIALIFDFPDNQNDASEIMNLSTKYGVYISLRQKQRQSTLSIVIKGIEKFIDKIYEARHDILRLTTPMVKPDIPETYFTSEDKDLNLGYRTALTALLSGYIDSPKTPSLLNGLPLPISPYNSSTSNHNLLMNNKQQHVGFSTTPTGVCAPTQKYLQMHNNNFNRQQANHNNNYLQIPNIMGPQIQQHQQQPQQQPQPAKMPPGFQHPATSTQANHMVVSPRNSCSHNTSGYQSFSSSTTSLEQAYPPFNIGLGAANANANGNASLGIGSNTRTHFSPDSTYSSEISCARFGRRSSDGVLLGLGASGPLAGSMIPGSAEIHRNLHYDFKNSCTFDYDMKRAMGFKAMERPPISGALRTPNTNWSGMGLSRTSPAPLETTDELGWHRNIAAGFSSPYNLGITTGLIDATPTNRRLHLSHHKDIHSLLTSLGLEHYIKVFIENEIDLEMFTTLTEDNLMELGIKAFGARKKLLVAIHALQANEASTSTMPASSINISSPRFSGSAAPGAERRPSNQW